MPKTKIEIIDETVEFYGADPKGRRSVDAALPGFNKCAYKGSNGGKCAFARCVQESFVESILSINEGRSAWSLMNEYGDAILKPEYTGHDSDFWAAVQQIHDEREFWNDNGISEVGRSAIENLKQKYAQ